MLTTYGRSSGFCIDPIEKKPLNHFLPGTPILSLGTAGCNLGCRFCQNWDISKSREMDTLAAVASPEAIVATAKQTGCRSIAFTYNDPVIWAEYAIDTARIARAEGIKTVAVTAGYISPEPRKEFFSWMDAANVDLKAFTEDFYHKLTKAHLQPVLDTLKYLKDETGIWFEITTLIIPGENDSPDEIDRLCQWVLANLGDEVPLHFSAFHPAFKVTDTPATPPDTLIRARQQAVDAGVKFAYVGNVHDRTNESTYCPSCGQLLIERDWYELGTYELDGNQCGNCRTTIPGVFDRGRGDWGRRRQPVRVDPAIVPAASANPSRSEKMMFKRKKTVKPKIDFTRIQVKQILDYTKAVVDAAVLDEPVEAELSPQIADAPAYGVFVTLNRKAMMRACRGHWGGSSENSDDPKTLGQLLRSVAADAATRDTRFPRICVRELELLSVDVSIMHSPGAIEAVGDARIDAIKVGKHGLVISHPQGRGLLLPHVATQSNWDAKTFLDQVARKAGLDADAWREDAAELMTFQTRLITMPPAEDELDVHELTPDRLFELVRAANNCVKDQPTDDDDIDPVLVRHYEEELGLYVLAESGQNATALGAGHSLMELAELAGKSFKQMLADRKAEMQEVTRLAVLWQPIRLRAADYPERHQLLSHSAVLAQSSDSWSLTLPRSQDPTDRVGEALSSIRASANQWLQSESQGDTMPRLTAFSLMGFDSRRHGADTASRPAARAGQFYPAGASEVDAELAEHMAAAGEPSPKRHRAVMLPHAGWRYCGDTIARTLARVAVPSSVIVIGPNHTGEGAPWSIAPQEQWLLPGGSVPIDAELVRRLMELVPQLECEPDAHRMEHCIEVLLPFLRRANPGVRVVPILIGRSDFDQIGPLAQGLAQVIEESPDDPPLLVLSSDMNHFASEQENRRLDMLAIDAMLTGDPQKLYDTCTQNDISMCGLFPTVIGMQALIDSGEPPELELVHYCNSAEATGDKSSVVGYAGVLLS